MASFDMKIEVKFEINEKFVPTQRAQEKENLIVPELMNKIKNDW